MTVFGVATLCFTVCFVVAVLFQLQLGTKKDVVWIEPFPKVTLISPLQRSLLRLAQGIDLMMEMRQHPVTSLSFSSGDRMTTIIKLERLAEYELTASRFGVDRRDNRLTIEVAGANKTVHAEFEKNNVRFIYSASIFFRKGGQILENHLDVARALIQSLNGEPPYIDAEKSNRDCLESLRLLTSKYGIEVNELR